MSSYLPEIVPAKHNGFVFKHTDATGRVCYEGRDGFVTRFPENTQPFKTQTDAQVKYREKYESAR